MITTTTTKRVLYTILVVLIVLISNSSIIYSHADEDVAAAEGDCSVDGDCSAEQQQEEQVPPVQEQQQQQEVPPVVEQEQEEVPPVVEQEEEVPPVVEERAMVEEQVVEEEPPVEEQVVEEEPQEVEVPPVVEEEEVPPVVEAVPVVVEESAPTKPQFGSIEGTLHYPDMSIFNLTTRITLNNDEYTTYSRVDGTFVIYNIPPGIHQIDIHNTNFLFSTVKIQFLDEMRDETTQELVPKCLEYPYPGASKIPITYPLVLTAHGKYEYFEQKRGFSFLVILKNPMFLMMAFSVGMMFVMPKMMENLDPEEKERMQKQMEMQKDPTKMLSQIWGDITGENDGATAGGAGSPRKKGKK